MTKTEETENCQKSKLHHGSPNLSRYINQVSKHVKCIFWIPNYAKTFISGPKCATGVFDADMACHHGAIQANTCARTHNFYYFHPMSSHYYKKTLTTTFKNSLGGRAQFSALTEAVIFY